MLSIVVTSQEEKIKEVANDYIGHLVPDIPVFLKIKTQSKSAPLKLKFDYMGAFVKSLKVYLSHDRKEPGENSNLMRLLNPTSVVLQSGKTFEKEWLYITLYSEVEASIKI
jgi:hypothetical protein